MGFICIDFGLPFPSSPEPPDCVMGLMRNSDCIPTFSISLLHITFQLSQRICSLAVRTTGNPGLCTLMTLDAEQFWGGYSMENHVCGELLFSFETQNAFFPISKTAKFHNIMFNKKYIRYLYVIFFYVWNGCYGKQLSWL